MAEQVNWDAEKPSLSAVVTDVNPVTLALTGNADTLVRYCSTARATAQYQPQNGAAIASYFVVNNGALYTDNPADIAEVEKGEFRFRVVDSRGYHNTVNVIKSMIPYVRLTCKLAKNKPNGNGAVTVKVSGDYFPGSFGAQNNSLTVQYRCKLAGTTFGAWVDMPVTVAVRSYTAEVKLTGLDYKSAYVFQARAIDKLATVEAEQYAARAKPVFDWDADDFNINGTLKLNQQPLEDFVVARGNTGIWTWERWNSGVAKCWGRTEEKSFTFMGSGPVYYSQTVHSASYPFALTEITSLSADIVSPGCVVPVVLSTEESVRTTYIRLYGTAEAVAGYYTFTVLGRWK